MSACNSRFIAVFVVMLLALGVGCRNDADSNNGQGAKNKIAIAYALGGKGDQSYNDAVDLGAKELRELGVEVEEFEPAELDSFAAGVSALSVGKPKIVFCVGYLYDEHIKTIAKRHPDVTYVILDGSSKGENYSSVKFDAKSGSRLAGILAAKMTKTKKIAFVGGTNIDIINEFRDGFSEGAKSVDPEITLESLYVGAGGSAFTDPVKGREVALAAIGRECDVLYHAAGTSGNGVIKAAAEKGVFAIGVDVDQNHLAPDAVAASVIKDFGAAMKHVISLEEAGKSIRNQHFELGLDEKAVYLGYYSGFVTADQKAAVENATVEVSSGDRQ